MSSTTSVTSSPAFSPSLGVGDPRGSSSATYSSASPSIIDDHKKEGHPVKRSAKKEVLGYVTSLQHAITEAGQTVTPIMKDHYIIARPEFPHDVDHRPGTDLVCLLERFFNNVRSQRNKIYGSNPELMRGLEIQSRTDRLKKSLRSWTRNSDGHLYPDRHEHYDDRKNPRFVFCSFPLSYFKILQDALGNIADPTKLDEEFLMDGVIEDIQPTLKEMAQFKGWGNQPTHDGTTRDLLGIIAGYGMILIFRSTD